MGLERLVLWHLPRMDPLPPGAGQKLCSHQATLSSTQCLYLGPFPAMVANKLCPNSSLAGLPCPHCSRPWHCCIHHTLSLALCFSRMIWGMQLTELGVPWCSHEDTAAAQVITVHRQHAGSKGLGKETSSGGTSPKPTWQPMHLAESTSEGHGHQ